MFFEWLMARWMMSRSGQRAHYLTIAVKTPVPSTDKTWAQHWTGR